METISGDWGFLDVGIMTLSTLIYYTWIFFCSYGYFVGSILLILLFGVIAWAFWITRGKTEQVFIVFLFSISIIKLMLSGTYILEPFFYFLIGACAKVIFFRNSSEMK